MGQHPGKVGQHARNLQFNLKLREKLLEATVIGTVDHPLYYVFRVQFSDGHEDDFTFWEEFFEGETDNTEYATAIRPELSALIGFTSGLDLYIMQLKIEDKLTNVWIIQSYDEESKYAVRFNGDYRFHMEKCANGWEAKSHRVINPEIVDDVIAKEIGHMLYYYRGE